MYQVLLPIFGFIIAAIVSLNYDPQRLIKYEGYGYLIAVPSYAFIWGSIGFIIGTMISWFF